MVVDDDPRQAGEQVCVTNAHVPYPLQRPTVRDDDQVVGRRLVRICAEPINARDEAIQRRDRIGTDRISRSPERLNEMHHAKCRTKGVRVGETVGYGGRFIAERPVTLAVIPAGYADGLDRRLEGRGAVLIRGRRAPIVGAVSMDMLTVDVTDIDAVGPGDEVVFLGSQGSSPEQTIDAREMAAWIGTIPYEILCRLGSRVERKYD